MEHYIICCQWFEEFREKLNIWISEQDSKASNQKMDVFVLPNPKQKLVLSVGVKPKKKYYILHIILLLPI